MREIPPVCLFKNDDWELPWEAVFAQRRLFMEQAPFTASLTGSLTAPDLGLTGILVGLIIALTHAVGLALPGPLMQGAKEFPRSRAWGTALLLIATLWTAWLAHTTDLGEFSPMRALIVLGTAVSGILLWKFVPDFLSSRSLGFLLLLAAGPVLEAVFLRHGILKLALALLAYVWALAGLFLVGMPVLHRDLITWVCARKERWSAACWAGLLYGLFLVIAGLLREFAA